MSLPIYHLGRFQIVLDPFGWNEVLLLSGWCFEPGSPEPVTLELHCDGQTLRSLSCQLAMPDVAEAFPAYVAGSSLPRCGFHTDVYLTPEIQHLQIVSPRHGFVLGRASREELTFDLPGVGEPAHAELAAPELSEADPLPDPEVAQRAEFSASRSTTPDRSGSLQRSLKLLCLVHNLNLEGGPKILLESVGHLDREPHLEVTAVSFMDGPLRPLLAERGIACEVLQLDGVENILHGWRDADHMERSVEQVAAYLQEQRADVVMSAVLNSFFVVEAAWRADVPSLWFIQESYNAAELRRLMPPYALPMCRQAFNRARQVVFGSHETRELYRRFDRRKDFVVVYNALEREEVDAYRSSVAKARAREEIGADGGRKVILSLGTVCSRKQQEVLVRAAAILATLRDDFLVYVVGMRENDSYSAFLDRLVRHRGLESIVRLIPETPEVHRYYRAADLFVMTSLVESYSFAILEAMAHALPVVSTPACGVREQIRSGVNGLLFPFGDGRSLAEHLDRLLSDDERRARMSGASRSLFDSMQTPEETATEYGRLVVAAWLAGPRASEPGPRR